MAKIILKNWSCKLLRVVKRLSYGAWWVVQMLAHIVEYSRLTSRQSSIVNTKNWGLSSPPHGENNFEKLELQIFACS
jgi:hypothetical protein